MLTLHYEIVGIGYLGSLNHLLHGSIFNAKGDVVVKGVVKQNGLLVDIAYQSTKVRQSKRLYIYTINAYFAPCNIMIARQKVDQCRLARTTLPHKGYGLSAMHC